MTLRNGSDLKTALLLVDVQQGLTPESGFYGKEISGAPYPTNIPLLLDAFRKNKLLIIHVQHNSIHKDSPLYPGKPTHALCSFAAPISGELVFTKTVNSAFVGTDVERTLRENNIKRLVVLGTTTDHCVSTTVRMAANMDVVGSNPPGNGEVLLVGDACAAFDKGDIDAETVHRVHLASLDGEFCKVISTQDVLDLVG